MKVKDHNDYSCREFLVEIEGKEFWVLIQYGTGSGNVARIIDESGYTAEDIGEFAYAEGYSNSDLMDATYKYNDKH